MAASSHRMTGRKQHRGAWSHVVWLTVWSAGATLLPAAAPPPGWDPGILPVGSGLGQPCPPPPLFHTPPAELSTHSVWRDLSPQPPGQLLPGRGRQPAGQRTPGPGDTKTPGHARQKGRKKNSGFGRGAPQGGEGTSCPCSSAHVQGKAFWVTEDAGREGHLLAPN